MYEDWRLTNQLEYLNNKNLIKTKYVPYRTGWDHDHCAFCNEEINEKTGISYATEDKYHWICNECYEDFKKIFNWCLMESDQ